MISMNLRIPFRRLAPALSAPVLATLALAACGGGEARGPDAAALLMSSPPPSSNGEPEAPTSAAVPPSNAAPADARGEQVGGAEQSPASAGARESAPEPSLTGAPNEQSSGSDQTGDASGTTDDADAQEVGLGPAPTRESASAPGPFGVQVVTTGLRDGPDYGTQTLHIPEEAEPPFAAVAIVPGFNTPEASIQAWGPFLASHGIVTLTIGTNGPLDSAEARARALLDALETLRVENSREGGPVGGMLAVDRLGIMGWSLGGGGVLSATATATAIKAAVTMAVFAPGLRLPDQAVPTLFLAGSADMNAGGQSQGIFESIPETTPKALFEVEGGPHEIGNDPANVGGLIGLFGLSWLELFLLGDERYRSLLTERPAQASDFRQNLTPPP